MKIARIIYLILISAAPALLPICSAFASDLAEPELIMVSRSGVQAALERDIFLVSTPLREVAAIAVNGYSEVTQIGQMNRSDISQAGRGNDIKIVQTGSRNTSTAHQVGALNSVDLTQHGDRNSAIFHQAGGARASLYQDGDFHTAEISQFSTGPSISVGQSGVGTVIRTIQY